MKLTEKQEKQEQKAKIAEFWANMPKWANYVWKGTQINKWEWCVKKPRFCKVDSSWGFFQRDFDVYGYIPKKFEPKWYKGLFKDSLMKRPK